MIRSSRMLRLNRVRWWQWKGGPVRSMDGHWFVERRPGDRKMENEMEEMWVQGGCVDLWQWKWWKNEKNSEMLQRLVVWNWSRGRAIMVYRRRRRTWPGENDEDDDRTKVMNKAKVTERTRNTRPKMRKIHSNSLFHRIGWAIMADWCWWSGERVRTMTMKREKSLFVVSPNRELKKVWERLPVKNLFISVNFNVFMLNFYVQFELIAEIMKIESKYMTRTVMFVAFQKVLSLTLAHRTPHDLCLSSIYSDPFFPSPPSVTYLGFQKGVPNFRWPLVLIQGPNQVFQFFLWWKKFFFVKGGPWVSPPWIL